MATVVRACDVLLERDVAIKTLTPRNALDAATQQRFLIEARAAAAIVHPNVVAVYDVLVDAAHPAIVMEYVGGGSLAALLRRNGALAPERAVAYARQIAAALTAAHERGVVHRDIKPSNMLLTPDAATVKVADFGIAKLKSSDDLALTQPGGLLGSAQYTSPEQAQGLRLTAASDLYSVGVVLHEMLAGTLPFAADGAVASAVAHVTQPAPSREMLSRSMPSALAAIVHRLLRKDPAERFTSARELDAALAAIDASALGGDRDARGAERVASVSSFPERRRRAAARTPASVRRASAALEEHGTAFTLTAVAALLLIVIVWAGTRAPAAALADVRRTQLLHAQAMLAARGLRTEIIERADSADPAGSVIDQEPAAGTRVQRGDRVRLIVSGGRPLVVVPELRGRSYAEARSAMRRLALTATFAQSSSDAPPGMVLAQDPQPGTQLTPGSTETIVVSADPPPFVGADGFQIPAAGPPGRRKHGRPDVRGDGGDGGD